jgi:hypothetical protein
MRNLLQRHGFNDAGVNCPSDLAKKSDPAMKLQVTSSASAASNAVKGVGSEVMAMRERFTVVELNALRSDLLQGGLIDSREAAELLQVFLMGRGYGVSPQAAFDAAGRVEMSGCSIPVLQHELENLAMVM